MKKAIFVCGSTGSGKTTYSSRLSAGLRGLHLSIDELMKALFWMDAPTPVDFEWAQERVNRCESVVQAISEKALALGVPVVLDLGFSERTQRSRFRDWASRIGCPSELHYLDVPAEERWARVSRRNQEPGRQSIPVDRATFEWMERYFEPPSEEENPLIVPPGADQPPAPSS